MSDATKELIDALRTIATMKYQAYYKVQPNEAMRDAALIAEGAIAKSEAALALPQADADDWIPWKGGSCPVSFDAVVEVRCRDGHKYKMKAQNFRWVHAGQTGMYVFEESNDIIAYHIGIMTDLREALARAICASCDENPDHSGDCQGNQYRWQDYLPCADAALAVFEAEKAK